MGDVLKNVEIHTDGACSCNPGPGGWAAILLYNGKEKICSGGEPATTNNRMELMAAIQGLKMLNQCCNVTMFSDSAYMINALEKGWLEKWRLNSWKTTGKDDVKNRDLWEELALLCKRHVITWNKVKGHSDNEFNNRCDESARAEIIKITGKTNGAVEENEDPAK